MKDTLCWTCKNAINGCSWAKRFEPVENWVATPTKIKMDKTIVDSYCVHECPKFVADKLSFRKTTTLKLSRLLNISIRTFFRWSDETLISELAKIGYRLDIYLVEKEREYYISKINKKGFNK